MTEKIGQEEIQKVIKSVPLLSASANQLLQATTDPDHDLLDIVKVVKTDATLTARVLKVINSAAFGLINEITSLDRAISYMGERLIVGIAIGDCASQLFDKELKGYEGEHGDLWRHDLRTAIASREVVVQSDSDINPDLAFTAGLLHDIGKALISDYLQGTASEVLGKIESETFDDYLSAEEELIGFDHPRAGYELALAWKLPEAIAEVIRFHHTPAAAREEFKELVYAVHLGDNIAMMGGCGTGADTMQYKLDSDYTQFIQLEPNALASVMLAVNEEFTKLNGSFSESGESNQ
jgi:putative nucleotidyltransferase with HDIG domain